MKKCNIHFNIFIQKQIIITYHYGKEYIQIEDSINMHHTVPLNFTLNHKDKSSFGILQSLLSDL